MDLLDQKILALLDEDPLIPTSQLAKKLRISQQTVNYRYLRMLRTKTIGSLSTVINLFALGFENYRIFLNLNPHTQAQKTTLHTYLCQRKEIYWTGRIGGPYDLAIVINVRNYKEALQFIDTLNSSFPNIIHSYRLCYGIEHRIFRHRYLGNDNPRSIPFISRDDDPLIPLDAVDWVILKQLAKNCRASSLEIAKGQDFSYRTVINRIKQLRKNKIILGERMYVPSKDYFPYMILISYRNYTMQREDSLLNHLSSRNDITQLIRLFGSWDLLIHIRAKNLEDVQQAIIDIRATSDIIDTYTIIPIFENIITNLLPV